MTTTNNNTAQQLVDLVLNSWITQNKVVSSFFSKYEDDYYLNEVAPGRNRAVYLLGHLISANDSLLPLLGFSEKLYPELEETFSRTPDKAVANIPSVALLKTYWENLNTTLATHFSSLQPEEWLQRHTRVSEEDFTLDPKRNKINVLLGRINHQSYHVGQLVFLSKKEIIS